MAEKKKWQKMQAEQDAPNEGSGYVPDSDKQSNMAQALKAMTHAHKHNSASNRTIRKGMYGKE